MGLFWFKFLFVCFYLLGVFLIESGEGDRDRPGEKVDIIYSKNALILSKSY